MVGNQAHVGLSKLCRQLLNRNRIFETDGGLDAERSAERLDLGQIVARTDYPETDERKAPVQQGQRPDRGIKTQTPGNCAMANDREWPVSRLVSPPTRRAVCIRDWKNARVGRV